MSDPTVLAERIGATWFGSDLRDACLQRLGSMAREYESPARTRLLREGDETKELSILEDGRIALTEHIAGRGSVTLMSAEPGDVFGWTAIIPPPPSRLGIRHSTISPGRSSVPAPASTKCAPPGNASVITSPVAATTPSFTTVSV